ncbi:hypothetical protein O5O45_11585 [Hahella aquimaris]|uniref:hypothetical protein n=1 Tax=Hahella sp. HNIBRBA332 TaxID=3015983 RepID=UPI00273B48D6|nr:hypothetical protein [Hahella sp. HNIBRBA332]WLQ16562.1 hypothetical protein O5O45_11585 [Hahella sp. HNIBRBA332]
MDLALNQPQIEAIQSTQEALIHAFWIWVKLLLTDSRRVFFMGYVKDLNVPFSTADAEAIKIHSEKGELTLCYQDWREQSVEIRFNDVVAFKWSEAMKLLDGERDDLCYEICDSDWMKRYCHQGLIDEKSHRHYKLNFNDMGQLEVLATCYNVKESS